jgi:predicted lipoprotein with Yx(FWY)xxD motif
MFTRTTLRCSAALLVAAAAACTRHNGNKMDTSSAAGAIAPDTTAPAAATSMAPAATGIIVTVATRPGTGVYLADANGRALYVLDKAPSDTDDWKPVSGASAPTSTDTAVKADLLGTTTGPSGAQATYAGKPLYYYSDDEASGDVKGDGKKEDGATGHLIRPDGSLSAGKHKM